MPSPIRHDDVLLRLIKDVNDIRATLRRVVANLPLYDIANENTPAVLSSNQNNYPPGNYDILMLEATQNVTITGITNGVKGRRLQLFNVGSNAIILSHENANSLAVNRFKFQTGFSASLDPNTNLTVYYYSTIERWITGTEIFDVAGLWTTRTGLTGTWYDVIWANSLGLFVAVGSGANKIMTSPDGIIWSPQSAPATSTLFKGVGWSEDLGMLVAVGDGSGVGGLGAIATSTDGVNWTPQTPAFNTHLEACAWSPTLGIFVVVGGDNLTDSASNKIMTSANGTAWNSRTGSQTKAWNDVVWSEELGIFVAVGGGGTTDIAYSSNGIAWTGSLIGSVASYWGSVAWSAEKSRFVAIRIGSATETYSSDGINWNTPVATPAAMTDIAWSPQIGIFIGVCATAFSYYSIDGISWVLGSASPPANALAVCWSVEKNIFVAVGTNLVMTTP